MPTPVQLVGEARGCVLIVPLASQCHEDRLGCCSSSSSWEVSHLSLLCISSRTFFLQCGLITVAADKVLFKLKKASWCS